MASLARLIMVLSALGVPACGSSHGGGDGDDDGITCATPPCPPVSLSQTQVDPYPIAVGAGHVAWIDHTDSAGFTGTVRVVSTSGGSASDLAMTVGIRGQQSTDLAVDDQNVYWVSAGSDATNLREIDMVPVTGGAQATLYTDPSPSGVVDSVVALGGAIYTSSSQGVVRVDRSSGAVTSVSQAACGGLITDGQAIYCIDFVNGVLSIQLPSGHVTPLVPVPTSSLLMRSIAVDDANVYLAVYSNADMSSSIESAPLAGGAPAMFAADVQMSSSIVANDAGLFWVAPGNTGFPVMRLDVAGGAPVVAESNGNAAFLAADAHDVYVSYIGGDIEVLGF